jgi:hypothetical protein
MRATAFPVAVPAGILASIRVSLMRMARRFHTVGRSCPLPRAATPVTCLHPDSLHHPHREDGKDNEQGLDGFQHVMVDWYQRTVPLARRLLRGKYSAVLSETPQAA